jgi:chromosome segregation ATPase
MSAPGSGNSGGLNNRFNSYQQSHSGKIVAEQQTNSLSDTVATQYQAEETANNILNQLHGQRQQIQGANDDVWETRQLTEETKRELHALQAKYREKKTRLKVIIALLGFLDFFMFFRLLRCRGSFFC